VVNTLPILGVLTAGIGGFIFVASWDSRPRIIAIIAYTLVGIGIARWSLLGLFCRP
jgi:hypothetical protein